MKEPSCRHVDLRSQLSEVIESVVCGDLVAEYHINPTPTHHTATGRKFPTRQNYNGKLGSN